MASIVYPLSHLMTHLLLCLLISLGITNWLGWLARKPRGLSIPNSPALGL